MKPGDLVGLNIFDLYSPETVGNIKRAYAGETVHYVSYEYDHYWESWHLPARNKDGEFIGIIGVGLDVSESKRKENELSTQLELIQQQQQIIRELGTPIIQVWDEVLTVPMMGVVDSRRAADLMDDLLAEVARTRARFTILDLTGVEVLDTATASHILRMVASIRLLGAEGIITGIQPTVAQTMIAIGVDLSTIVTLATLRDGLKLCMKKLAVRSTDLDVRGGPARSGMSVRKDKPF
jgi:rsbT co-antagonist protein RsbR